MPITASEQILLTKQSVRIDGRHFFRQGERGQNSLGLPTQVLRVEQDDTGAWFVWDQKGQAGSLGRLHILKNGPEQDLLDQIVATTVMRVYQEVRRQKLSEIGETLVGGTHVRKA
jgi:hypothetical protein